MDTFLLTSLTASFGINSVAIHKNLGYHVGDENMDLVLRA